MTCADSKPTVENGAHLGGEHRGSRRRQADHHSALDTGRSQLGARLIAVATVGDQHDLVVACSETHPLEPVKPVSQRMLSRSLTEQRLGLVESVPRTRRNARRPPAAAS